MRIRDLRRRAAKRASATVYVAAVAAGISTMSAPAQAHPHVFVDGGVDFSFDETGQINALKVTWIYDAFESLYILSSNDMTLTADDQLSEEDRQQLIETRSQWPDDFDGAAHLTVDGASMPLSRPIGFNAELVDGRLHMTFTRTLEQPVTPHRSKVEVAFYEATFFYAFAVTNTPRMFGATEGCTAQVIPFKADAQDKVLKATLSKLSREETPDVERIGAVFADRISVQCAS